MKLGSPAIDYATGITGAFALASALFQRERTGRGQRIDMAMLDVAMILMSSHLTGYLRNGVHPKPHGNKHPHATNSAYATKNGLLMLGASNLRQQRRLWTVLDRPDMIKRSNEEREQDHDREAAVLAGDPPDPHCGGMGRIPAGPPYSGGAGAQHGRGARGSAACKSTGDTPTQSRPRHRRGNRRAGCRFHLCPWGAADRLRPRPGSASTTRRS